MALIVLLAEEVGLSPARHVAPDLAEIPEALTGEGLTSGALAPEQDS